MDKLLRSEHLYEALDAAGICSIAYAPKWLRKMEQAGQIVYPRNYAAEPRKFTQRQINEIVVAFRPGGKQKWKLK